MNATEGHRMIVKSSAVIHKGKLYFHANCISCGDLTAYVEASECRHLLTPVNTNKMRSLYVESVEKLSDCDTD